MKTETENLRELDCWIAEHLFGAKNIEWITLHSELGCPTEPFQDFGGGGEVFRYTTDPASSMLVLEKCAESGVLNGEFKVPVVIRRRGDRQFVVSESSEDESEDSERSYIVVEAETLPLAICKFARKIFSK